MIIDGTEMARRIFLSTAMRAKALARPPRVTALVASETLATKSYLVIKSARATDAGCVFSVVQASTEVTTESLRAKLAHILEDVDSVLVQLPLPERIDAKSVCSVIPPEKDPDVLSETSRNRFERQEEGALLPPVVGAVKEVLTQGNISILNKKVSIVGDGWLVGRPCSLWFSGQGAHVTVVTSSSTNYHEALKSADIIIAGAGSPSLIRPEHISYGAVLIDAGTSESNGALAGDADPSCAEKCSVFTPVPGGIGPIAVAKLFENAVILAERSMGGSVRG